MAEPGGAPRGSIGRSVSAMGFGFHRGIVGFTVEGLQGRAKRERSPGCRGTKCLKASAIRQLAGVSTAQRKPPSVVGMRRI